MSEFTEDFTHSYKTCFHCNGYYGPNFCQPLCTTCHIFLYPDDLSKLPTVRPFHEKTDDGDSGNEEPREPGDYYQTQEQLPQERQHYQQHPLEPQHYQQLPLEPHFKPQEAGSAPMSESDNFDFVEAGPSGVGGAAPMEVGGEGAGVSGGEVPSGSGSGMDSSSGTVAAPPGNGGPGGGGGGGGGLQPVLNALGVAGVSGVCGGAVPGVSASPNNAILSLEAVVAQSVAGREGGARGGSREGGGGESNTRIPKMRIPSFRSSEGRPMMQQALQEQLTRLSCPRPQENLDPTLIHRMPPEVWMLVFDFLDDMTLWAVGWVCRRWCQLVNRYVSNDQWQKYTKRRWPLFSTLYKEVPWQMVYTKLTESAPCYMCLHKMSLLTPPLNNENSWRRNRLRNELRTLRSDPPEGIQASPLDKLSVHWQASIRGPAGSPYEGGTFFLYIQIPHSYPLCPPVVSFITKIFHPNVSRHGDIGIDSIQHNWSLALTISKVLISIQSLLTDPYTKVCMEPDIGRLYESNKKQFECVAREWTWRYAMHDALPPEPGPNLPLLPIPMCGSSVTQVEGEDGVLASGTVGDVDTQMPLFLA